MWLIHKREEGTDTRQGINIMTNDKNAYFNITVVIPLFVRFKKEEFFEFWSGWYYNATLTPLWSTRVRIRTWRFVSEGYDSFFKRVRGMFIFGSAIDLKLVNYGRKQTVEDRQDYGKPKYQETESQK